MEDSSSAKGQASRDNTSPKDNRGEAQDHLVGPWPVDHMTDDDTLDILRHFLPDRDQAEGIESGRFDNLKIDDTESSSHLESSPVHPGSLKPPPLEADGMLHDESAFAADPQLPHAMPPSSSPSASQPAVAARPLSPTKLDDKLPALPFYFVSPGTNEVMENHRQGNTTDASFGSHVTPQDPAVAFIEQWQAVLSDKNAGNRTTYATVILRRAKIFYKQEKAKGKLEITCRKEAIRRYDAYIDAYMNRKYPHRTSRRDGFLCLKKKPVKSDHSAASGTAKYVYKDEYEEKIKQRQRAVKNKITTQDIRFFHVDDRNKAIAQFFVNRDQATPWETIRMYQSRASNLDAAPPVTFFQQELGIVENELLSFEQSQTDSICPAFQGECMRARIATIKTLWKMKIWMNGEMKSLESLWNERQERQSKRKNQQTTEKGDDVPPDDDDDDDSSHHGGSGSQPERTKKRRRDGDHRDGSSSSSTDGRRSASAPASGDDGHAYTHGHFSSNNDATSLENESLYSLPEPGEDNNEDCSKDAYWEIDYESDNGSAEECEADCSTESTRGDGFSKKLEQKVNHLALPGVQTEDASFTCSDALPFHPNVRVETKFSVEYPVSPDVPQGHSNFAADEIVAAADITSTSPTDVARTVTAESNEIDARSPDECLGGDIETFFPNSLNFVTGISYFDVHPSEPKHRVVDNKEFRQIISKYFQTRLRDTTFCDSLCDRKGKIVYRVVGEIKGLISAAKDTPLMRLHGRLPDRIRIWKRVQTKGHLRENNWERFIYKDLLAHPQRQSQPQVSPVWSNPDPELQTALKDVLHSPMKTELQKLCRSGPPKKGAAVEVSIDQREPNSMQRLNINEDELIQDVLMKIDGKGTFVASLFTLHGLQDSSSANTYIAEKIVEKWMDEEKERQRFVFRFDANDPETLVESYLKHASTLQAEFQNHLAPRRFKRPRFSPQAAAEEFYNVFTSLFPTHCESLFVFSNVPHPNMFNEGFLPSTWQRDKRCQDTIRSILLCTGFPEYNPCLQGFSYGQSLKQIPVEWASIRPMAGHEPWWNRLPPSRLPYSFNNVQEPAELASRLKHRKVISLVERGTLSAVAVAVQFARRWQTEGPGRYTIFLDASNDTAMRASYQSAIRQLTFASPGNPIGNDSDLPISALADSFMSLLSKKRELSCRDHRFLIIFAHVPHDEEFHKKFFSAQSNWWNIGKEGGGAYIITTASPVRLHVELTLPHGAIRRVAVPTVFCQ